MLIRVLLVADGHAGIMCAGAGLSLVADSIEGRVADSSHPAEQDRRKRARHASGGQGNYAGLGVLLQVRACRCPQQRCCKSLPVSFVSVCLSVRLSVGRSIGRSIGRPRTLSQPLATPFQCPSHQDSCGGLMCKARPFKNTQRMCL